MRKRTQMKPVLGALCFLATTWSLGGAPAKSDGFSQFIGLDSFSKFARSTNERGETVLRSPVIRSAMDWNELIVSWNAAAAPGTFLQLEASADYAGHATKFYSWGLWSPDSASFQRASAGRQKDDDGEMATDTLILRQPANAARIRVTLGGTNRQLPALKLLVLSFCNTQ